jgi:predicted ATPase
MGTLRVVLTGGPGAGKTTVLAELARRGFTVLPDSARAVIAERQAAGLPPRPAPEAFARLVLERDIAQYTASAASAAGVRFFDRCALEPLGMLAGLQVLQDADQALLQSLRFHPAVFLCPPWRAIYVTDAQRDHDFAHAERVAAKCARWYAQCGYTIATVPCTTVTARADFILQTLGLA